jgi:tetratricopeptide (TPR) repeat protein
VEGVALLARATSMTEQRNELYNLVPLQVWLGEAHLASGDAERARRHGEASLEMARTQPQRGTEAWAWRLLGEIAAQTDPPGVQEAETAYQEALTRASDLGMRPLVAHCHLGLVRLAAQTGETQKAQTHLTTAAEMYRDMGMDFWLVQVETGLRSVGSDARRVGGTP